MGLTQLVKRLIEDDHPLTVFREYRGLSKASGVERVQIGSVLTLTVRPAWMVVLW